MLRVSELAHLRAEAEKALTQRGSVVNRAFPVDGHGGQTPTETVNADVPCLVLGESKSPGERVVGGVVESFVQIPILVPVTTEVTTSSSFQVDSVTYDVIGIDNRSNKVLKRLVCARKSQ
jgi:hypothetical protein